MNAPVSWDPTLVKKFSSSNHIKLLNQLKKEVIKYPLNNKKNSSSQKSNENNMDNKAKSNVNYAQDEDMYKSSDQKIDSIENKSTVSFNNAKDFSIYNQSTNNWQNESVFSTQLSTGDLPSSKTPKERFNQIDFK